jgi:glycerate 2-kinase
MAPEVIRTQLRTLFSAAVDAVDPRFLIQRMVRVGQSHLQVRQGAHSVKIPFSGQVFVIGAGKGAGPLAQGLEAVLGEQITGGAIVIPHRHTAELHRVAIIYGEHPFPGPGSIAGAEHMTSLLAQREAGDLICCCLTGGASSLLVSPAAGLSLADKLAINQLLLACGADIHAVNTVRKHLSAVKGGGLARLAFPATLVCFLLSDVVGDDLSTIGSGPTVADPTTFRDAWTVLEQYNLITQVPFPVLDRLRRGMAGEVAETAKPGDPIFTHVHNFLIGSNRQALEAAALTAQDLGFAARILAEPLSGDTTATARRFSHTLQACLYTLQQPLCLLAGGETTVHVTGQGKGGRNQEFALVVAQELQGVEGWTLLSAGTDGIDGPTEAAGAFADGRSIPRATRLGLDSQAVLKEHNTYPFFMTVGDLFTPGPTGTNVMDIKIALLTPGDSTSPSSLAKGGRNY